MVVEYKGAGAAVKRIKQSKNQWDLSGNQEGKEAYIRARKNAKRAVAKTKALAPGEIRSSGLLQ